MKINILTEAIKNMDFTDKKRQEMAECILLFTVDIQQSKKSETETIRSFTSLIYEYTNIETSEEEKIIDSIIEIDVMISSKLALIILAAQNLLKDYREDYTVEKIIEEASNCSKKKSSRDGNMMMPHVKKEPKEKSSFPEL